MSPYDNAQIVAIFGKQVQVSINNKEIIEAKLQNSAGSVLCGDFVELINDNGNYKINKRLDRKNYLYRIKENQIRQNLSANIDRLLIICSVNPGIDNKLIDKIIIVCHKQNIYPVLIINKIDLINNSQKKHKTRDMTKKDIEKLVDCYSKIMDVFLVSALDIFSYDGFIKSFQPQQINMLTGESGVGKSTLTNALTKNENVIETCKTNDKGVGRHTTCTTQMYDAINNSKIIDSPGLRDFIGSKIDKKDIKNGFVEFFDVSCGCKYKNCYHINEPNCAVKDAVKNKTIARFRYDNYLNFLKT
ncbi:MAG: ribosome small subunit-dependent GTPase A [Gammaproteobacteria bacterium]|nr:MAG: ribosome small subunit-dependent GTPase A [Gammaproteobacteria bacterium]